MMKIIITALMLLSLSTSLKAEPLEASSEFFHTAEHLTVKLPPQEGTPFIRIKEFILRVTDKGEEKILLTTQPALAHVQRETIDNLIAQLASHAGDNEWTVFEQTENEAIVGWKIKNSSLILTRLMITPFGYHSASYAFIGQDCSSVNIEKWIKFLKCNVAISKF